MRPIASTLGLAVLLGSLTAACVSSQRTGEYYAGLERKVERLFDAHPAAEGEIPPANPAILTEYAQTVSSDPKAYSKPNFAHRFHLTSFGCGTECQTYLILNPSDPTRHAGFSTRLGAEFRLESRLIVANPPSELVHFDKDELPPTLRPTCYLWTEAEELEEIDCGF